MKKYALFIALFAVILCAAGPAQSVDWKGQGEGEAWTWTDVNLTMGKFCLDGFKGYGISATQDGSAGLSLSGKEKYVDKVQFEGTAKYNTGYDTYQKVPGGYMTTWGNQSVIIDGAISSGHGGH